MVMRFLVPPIVWGPLLWLMSHATMSAAEEVAARFAELQEKIALQDQSLVALSSERMGIDKSLKGLRVRLAELRKVAQVTQRGYQAARERRGAVEVQLSEIRVRMRDLSTRSRERVRALYRYRFGESFFEQVVSYSGDLDLLKRGYYLSLVREHDHAILSAYRAQVDRYEATEIELQKAVTEQSARQRELSTQESEIAQKVKEGDKLIASLKAKEAEAKQMLAELKAQVLRVEAVLASIVNQAEPEQEASEARVTVTTTSGVMAPFDGPGLEPKKGRLLFPVTGKVVREAPAALPPSFRELVAHRGVLFQSTARQEVVVVEAGKVLFVGEMPGFGSIVIVDHGARSYSLYGQLGEVRVKKGDTVSDREGIGSVKDHGILFFEIRKNGAVVPARGYFSE